ncbi:MAG: GMC oxidoreductase [Verrucomicrobiota bacterium]
MPFNKHYQNLVTEKSQAHTRLIRDYQGANSDFDFIIVGSGIGGGILADDLADNLGKSKRILVIDAGSFIYPTHVYHISRYSNGAVARHFGVVNRGQGYNDHAHRIGEEPQMNLGGRSVFWSGLIPTPQEWERKFFPPAVRADFESGLLKEAGDKMNASATLGKFGEAIAELFQESDLSDDFYIEETPRAVHQPYLLKNGQPKGDYYYEPTGVFNTAELLVNQVGLTPGSGFDDMGLFVKLNSFVEAIDETPEGWQAVRVTDTINRSERSFYAPKVVIAAGSTESPKLINRSSVYHKFTDGVRQNVGFGLTDHPVSSEAQIFVKKAQLEKNGAITESVPIERDDHAKIIFYSKGNTDQNGHIQYPFNIEMNINHEYWHLRHNDPSSGIPDLSEEDRNKVRVDIKFSFANLLDDYNGVLSHWNDGYKPDIRFKRWYEHHLLNERLPRIAGWHKDKASFMSLLRDTKNRVFSHFEIEGYGSDPFYSNEGWPFGWGTVHHACGTLRMPWREDLSDDSFNASESVVDTNLKVKNTSGLYVCDMSVMPISTAANPVRALGALALRLSRHLRQ